MYGSAAAVEYESSAAVCVLVSATAVPDGGLLGQIIVFVIENRFPCPCRWMIALILLRTMSIVLVEVRSWPTATVRTS
jgi:hypothetical protein